MAATKYRSRLTPAEEGLYDLMRKSSEILRGLAKEASDDIVPEESAVRDVADHLHDVVTYAFTLGVQFAVNRQQEVAMQVAKQMGLVPKES